MIGEFEVESLNFPGQVHKWLLSQLLQKGTERSRDSLLNDLALALRFIIVTAKGRLVSHFFSLYQAVRSLVTGLLKLLDIIIGVPSLQAHNLETKIREERWQYLVAELVCRSEFEDSLELLCGFVRRQLRRATTEKFEVERESSHPPVPVPYLFLTPKGVELDLRLFNRDTMRRALPALVAILERETRGWFLHFRERLISELRSQKLPDEEIEREVNQAVMKEYLQRVYTSILSHPDLLALGEGIPQLLVQQAQSVVLMHRAVENVQKKLTKTKDSLKQRIEYMYPVFSRIRPWMRDKLRSAENHFIEECQWSAHEEALMLCTSQRLHQTVYFLNRDLTFMREREPVLLKELRKVKTPTRSFQWLTQIWFPSNWIVRRSFQGQSEVIPTVQSATATSITMPRSDPSQAVFLVEKEVVRTTTTRWPMWRWINYCHRTWSWMWNAMFFFGVVIPWCSPVSLRALLCVEPFMPDLELSQVNGTLFPRKSSLTPTLASRLLSLWRHISKSRTHFETKPDTGEPLCLLRELLHRQRFHSPLEQAVELPRQRSARDSVCGFDIPPGVLRNKFLQPGDGSYRLYMLEMGVLRYWCRLLWDTASFHLVIKKRGRVPASDSFVVKRIAGPGLASNYFYQVRPEQALAAFEAKLELDELAAYQHETEQTILQPQKDFRYKGFTEVNPHLRGERKSGEPFRNTPVPIPSLPNRDLNLDLPVLDRLAQHETSALANYTTESVCGSVFRAFLCPIVQDWSLPVSPEGRPGSDECSTREVRETEERLADRTRCRRQKQDQNSPPLSSRFIAIQQAALMLERFYPLHVLQRLPINEEDYWESKGLSVHDWAGLAGLMYADIFSLDFLTPLDEMDTKFRLEPHQQVDLSRYTEMVHGAELGTGGPDLLGPVYAPRGNIQVHSPYLEVSAFNPRSKVTATNRKQEKRG
uniref:(California timema) hypothetical protein n=1 Tax=Timema californicum TaxID=61474 RepID=A0A7R9J3Q0_TIMCA|nr:unnamed protein product [Timema californicum]